MAATFSRPGCGVCAAINEGLGCGPCADAADTTRKARTKRRDVTKRAFKRAGIPTTDTGRRRVTLRCSQNHYWQSIATFGREDSVEDPKCDTCDQYFVSMGLVQGVYAEDVECLDNCKGAKDLDCRCSCAGANHGVNLGKRNVVKKKRR